VDIRVEGPDALEGLIGQLPVGSELFWASPGWASQANDPWSFLAYPPADIVTRVQEACARNHISLSMADSGLASGSQ
jgi:hypothetical protein